MKTNQEPSSKTKNEVFLYWAKCYNKVDSKIPRDIAIAVMVLIEEEPNLIFHTGGRNLIRLSAQMMSRKRELLN